MSKGCVHYDRNQKALTDTLTKEYRLQQTGIPVCVILGVQFRDHNIQEEISWSAESDVKVVSSKGVENYNWG